MATSYPDRTNARGIWKLSDITENIKTEGTWPDITGASGTRALWAGGSVPAFTSSGVDIVSFYWDTDEQQAYGVASLAFATP